MTSHTQSKFASKTSFHGLPVDSGEESSEDELTPQEEIPAPVQPENKLTKTAQKKLAKAARLEKKQKKLDQQKAQSPSTPVETLAPTSPPTEPVPPREPPEAGLTESTDPEPFDSNAEHTLVDSASREEPLASTQIPRVSTPPLPEPPRAPPPEPAANGQPMPLDARTVPEKSTLDPSVLQEKKLPVSNPPAPQDTEKAKKRQSVITRTLWTFIMIFGFIALLLLGPAYMIILVFACQGIVYREVTALFTLTSKDGSSDVKTAGKRRKDPWSKTLNWYFFAVTNYFLYGESIIYYFKHVVFVDAQLTLFANNHRLISFILYTIGLMGFVMSLKKGYLKQQFGLFCWVHMSLLLIVVSSHFIVNNILEGMIWFWVPASLVICNDIFAYIWGMTLGRTPLIELSPKKTVEGFVGAFISTILFSLAWGSYFMRFDYMICPVTDLGASAFNSVSCDPNPVFVLKDWVIPEPLATTLSTLLGRSISTVPYCSYHLHLIALAFFASLVAPFGGFFASGFKRAFNIKDFGHSIPGHGGMTDRMDCQFLMGVFTYVYYSSLIRQTHVTVGSALQIIVNGLSTPEQLQLLADLKKYLETQGVSVP